MISNKTLQLLEEALRYNNQKSILYLRHMLYLVIASLIPTILGTLPTFSMAANSTNITPSSTPAIPPLSSISIFGVFTIAFIYIFLKYDEYRNHHIEILIKIAACRNCIRIMNKSNPNPDPLKILKDHEKEILSEVAYILGDKIQNVENRLKFLENNKEIEFPPCKSCCNSSNTSTSDEIVTAGASK